MICRKPKKIGNSIFRCGKCLSCRIAVTREWAMRCMHEMGYHEKNVFVTLTYNDENIPANNEANKKEFTDFLKRIRKAGNKIRYYACGEYGEKTDRPHYHAIIFGLGTEDKDLIEKKWGKGFCKVGTVTYDSCRYVAEYIFKKMYGNDFVERRQPWKLQSQGLGKKFVLENKNQLITNLSLRIRGKEVALPRYYKEKLGLGNGVLDEKMRLSDFDNIKEGENLIQRRLRIEREMEQRDDNACAKAKLRRCRDVYE